jgi:predicted transposase/invertase (TIGR01784 family)
VYGNRDMDTELITMIGMITDSSELIRQGENGEVRNLCTALEELKNEGRLEGRLEGIGESALKLLRKGFSALEVANLLELTEEEVLKIQQKA